MQNTETPHKHGHAHTGSDEYSIVGFWKKRNYKKVLSNVERTVNKYRGQLMPKLWFAGNRKRQSYFCLPSQFVP